jgi:hypothetical protein
MNEPPTIKSCLVCGNDFKDDRVGGRPKIYCTRRCLLRNTYGDIIIRQMRDKVFDPIYQIKQLGLLTMNYQRIWVKVPTVHFD